MTDAAHLNDQDLARAIAREVAQLGGRVYYVGGYVRDQILGRENKDVDIEVHGVEVDALERVLATFGEVDSIGASFGILSLRGHTLDIAVPRSDSAAGAEGRADFHASADPFLGTYKAALRRDLTMNALYQDVLTEEVVDHFGGRDDLARGMIRHVDDTTFAEDPLRVLRVAQFAARFGMGVDESTTRLCAQLSLTELASERVLEELKKALLKAERPSIFFEELRKMDQLRPWFAEVADLIGVRQNPVWHPEGDVWAHTMLVLDEAAHLRGDASDPFAFMMAALCHDFGKAVVTEEVDGRLVSYGHEKAGLPLATSFLDRLGASTKVRRYVLNMVELHMLPNAHVAQHARQKSYNKLFDRSVSPADLLLLARADDHGRGNGEGDEHGEEELAQHLRAFDELMAKPFVQGRDLLEAGVEPGPLMGETLAYAHKLRLAGTNKGETLRQCLGYYRRLCKDAGVPCPLDAADESSSADA